jgi:hypothetical protein
VICNVLEPCVVQAHVWYAETSIATLARISISNASMYKHQAHLHR